MSPEFSLTGLDCLCNGSSSSDSDNACLRRAMLEDGAA